MTPKGKNTNAPTAATKPARSAADALWCASPHPVENRCPAITAAQTNRTHANGRQSSARRCRVRDAYFFLHTSVEPAATPSATPIAKLPAHGSGRVKRAIINVAAEPQTALARAAPIAGATPIRIVAIAAAASALDPANNSSLETYPKLSGGKA